MLYVLFTLLFLNIFLGIQAHKIGSTIIWSILGAGFALLGIVATLC